MRTSSSLRKIVWYMRRPYLHKEACRRISRRLTRRPNRENSTGAQQWCAGQSRPVEAVLLALGLGDSIEAPRDLFGSTWSAAREAIQGAPAEMGGAAYTALLFTLVRRLRPATVVETGVSLGWSSLACLLGLTEGAHLYSVDMPYVGIEADAWVGAAVPRELHSKWTLARGADRDVLPRLLRSTPVVGLAHYDSDKSYEGRMFAYPRLFDAMSPGGCLVSDDIEDNFGFRDFVTSQSSRWFVTHRPDGRFVGIVQKV